VTAPVSIALAIGALAVGVAIGFLLARNRIKRAEREPVGPSVAELLQRLVRSSNSGVVVLNRFGDLVLHNPRAYELGLVRVSQADPRARQAAEQVVETDEPMEIDLSPLPREARGRQPEAVLGEVRPLGDGFTVVEAVDHSDAVRLEATRRDFVANVSHELKTPVGAIALLTEAVLDAADDVEEVRRFGGKILRESTRLGQLVTELIALSRLQGAERLPDLNVVEVDAVVREALGRATLSAESAEITVTTDPASGLLIEGDRTLLVTALSNLLENAVAYSTAGSPVSISRRLVDGQVEIAVTDRGIGIAEEDQLRVFERFYRADKARSRATGGTGLGLAIVKHVAANHGGSVGLWSRQGTGSTFTLRIPAHRGPAGNNPEEVEASPNRLATGIQLPSPPRQEKSPARATRLVATGHDSAPTGPLTGTHPRQAPTGPLTGTHPRQATTGPLTGTHPYQPDPGGTS
jgi:two-component system sensor histidine kinase SenX3